MRRRNLIAAAVVLVAAAGGAWYAYGALFGSSVNAGAGDHQQALADCQERIFEDEMHPADMKFLDQTVWHEGTAADFTIGGKLSRVDYGLGRTMTFNYQCKVHGGRIFDAGIQ